LCGLNDSQIFIIIIIIIIIIMLQENLAIGKGYISGQSPEVKTAKHEFKTLWGKWG